MISSIATSFLLIISLATSYAFAASANPPAKLQLKYFDIKGAAETCRVLLAYGEEEYDDNRYQIDPTTFKSEEFLKAKESGDLKMNLNRAPVLITPDGKTIGQSKAIERFLAKRFGLMGDTAEDEAIIDCIAEHVRDVKDGARFKGFSKFAKGKTDEEKERDRKEWFEVDMPEMLEKLEVAISETSSSTGYSFGSKPSYSDVVIWSLLRDCFAMDLEDTRKASEKFTSLNAICDQVANNPGVAKWLKERPESMF